MLMVVSRDFGELSFALTFARCPALRATLLLPDNLYQPGDALDGVPAILYRGIDDVRSAVQSLQPDVVMLCSGYLFAIGGLFDRKAVSALIDELNQRGIPVLTSDPFLGLPFAAPSRPFGIALPGGAAMASHIIDLAAVLKDCTHVYMAPCADLQSPRRLSCGWPPALLRGHSATGRATRLQALSVPLRDDGFWLFVLSGEDFQLQIRQRGEREFFELLGARMADAHRAGRTPVLVAPAACIRGLTAACPATRKALLLPFCVHQQFEALLLGAEHAFYWNHLSHSLLARFINVLPTWFFAEGHLLRAIPDMRNVFQETFYPGFAVVDLDMRTALLPDVLPRLAAATRTARNALACRYEAMLQPDALIQQVLEQSGDGSGTSADASRSVTALPE